TRLAAHANPCRTSKRAVNGYANACAAVVRVWSIASPARVAATLSVARSVARSGHGARRSTATRLARASAARVRGAVVGRGANGGAVACARASKAPAYVTSAGQLAVSDGSTTAMSAWTAGWSRECFTPSTYTVATPVPSLPVPAVVGTSTSGARRRGGTRPVSTSIAALRAVGSQRTILATT